MAETMAAFNMVEHLGGRTYEPQHGDFSYARVMTPNRKPRRTADGWMVILPYSDRNWRAFFTHAGRPELADDERFVSGRSRIAHSDEIYGLLDDLVTARTTQEWLDICDAESIPCAPVLDLENIDADEHFDAVGLLQVEEHPTEGMFRYARDPIIMESNTPVLKHYPPRLGSDTVQVLEEIGYTSIQIDAITEGKA